MRNTQNRADQVFLALVVVFVGLCVAAFIMGTLHGYELRPALMAVLLGLWIGAEVRLRRWRKRVKAALRERADEDRSALLRSGLDGALIDDFVDREVRDWSWGINTALSGLYLFAVPPLLSASSRGGLSWDAEISGIDLLWMFAGVGTFYVLSWIRTRRYRCPNCGLSPDRLGGDALRFHCRKCRIVWYLSS